ncbi:uncharacterized protein A1O9_11653, partial [Exophiala aquamarina CBS 119918]
SSPVTPAPKTLRAEMNLLGSFQHYFMLEQHPSLGRSDLSRAPPRGGLANCFIQICGRRATPNRGRK